MAHFGGRGEMELIGRYKTNITQNEQNQTAWPPRNTTGRQ